MFPPCCIVFRRTRTQGPDGGCRVLAQRFLGEPSAVRKAERPDLGNRLDLAIVDEGTKTLKNIAQPVRVYSIGLEASAAGGPQASRSAPAAQPSAPPTIRPELTSVDGLILPLLRTGRCSFHHST